MTADTAPADWTNERWEEAAFPHGRGVGPARKRRCRSRQAANGEPPRTCHPAATMRVQSDGNQMADGNQMVGLEPTTSGATRTAPAVDRRRKRATPAAWRAMTGPRRVVVPGRLRVGIVPIQAPSRPAPTADHSRGCEKPAIYGGKPPCRGRSSRGSGVSPTW